MDPVPGRPHCHPRRQPGIFYGSVGGNLFTYPSNGEPFSGRPSFANVIHVSNPYATDPKDFCNGDPTCIAGGVGHSPYPFIYDPKNPQYVVTPAAIIPVDPNFHWPETYQFNFGFSSSSAPASPSHGSYVARFRASCPPSGTSIIPQFNLTSAGTPGAYLHRPHPGLRLRQHQRHGEQPPSLQREVLWRDDDGFRVQPHLLHDLADSVVGERQLQRPAGHGSEAALTGLQRPGLLCMVEVAAERGPRHRRAIPATAPAPSLRTTTTTISTGSDRTTTSVTSSAILRLEAELWLSTTVRCVLVVNDWTITSIIPYPERQCRSTSPPGSDINGWQ